MNGFMKRVAQLKEQVDARRGCVVAVFLKDGTQQEMELAQVLDLVCSRPTDIDHVECGPGCGHTADLINAML